MNFDIDVTTVQVYTCADGAKFNSLDDAKEHNLVLKQRAEDKKFQEDMEKKLDSYLNDTGLVGRNRVQKHTIISQFLEWERVWNGEFIEARNIEEEKVVVEVEEEVQEPQETATWEEMF